MIQPTTNKRPFTRDRFHCTIKHIKVYIRFKTLPPFTPSCRDAEDAYTELIHQRDIGTLPRHAHAVLSETPANYDRVEGEDETFSNPLYDAVEQDEMAEKEDLGHELDQEPQDDEDEYVGVYSYGDEDSLVHAD